MTLNAQFSWLGSFNEERILGIALDSKLWTLILIVHLFVKKQVKNLVLLQE